MKKEFDLGMTEEEITNAADDLAAEIDDFDLEENKVFYEIWVLGLDSDNNATNFEYLVDGEYTELEEAKKCFNFFCLPDGIELLKTKLKQLPTDTKHLVLTLEQCTYLDDDSVLCVDILEENKII